MAAVTYSVPEISCEGCANAIRRAVASLSGVQHVDVDLQAKRVKVDFQEDQTSPGRIEERIEEAGYEARPLSV
jgi:copper ion binding protein